MLKIADTHRAYKWAWKQGKSGCNQVSIEEGAVQNFPCGKREVCLGDRSVFSEKAYCEMPFLEQCSGSEWLMKCCSKNFKSKGM